MPFVPPPSVPDPIGELDPHPRRAYRLRGVDGPTGGADFGTDMGRLLAFVDRPGVGSSATTSPVVILFHGNPAWSFLWRKVISGLPEVRVIAPDLLGCGLSDGLPTAAHTLRRHLAALHELVDALALERVVLVGQDWGGPMATGLAARLGDSSTAKSATPPPAKVVGVVFGNTAVVLPKHPRGTSFHRLARVPLLSRLLFTTFGFVQRSLHRVQGDRGSIRGAVAAAYRWPLAQPGHRGTPLGLTRMVPDGPNHPSMPELARGEAWLRSFAGPVELVWGQRDPILAGALSRHQKALPHAHVTRTDAGHFLQEEVPEALIAAIRRVLATAAEPAT